MQMRNISPKRCSTEPSIKTPTQVKKVLVLDLDETLVFSLKRPLESNPNYLIVDAQNTRFYMYRRPGLKEFIVKMSKLYTLVLYTTGIKQYAKSALKALHMDAFFTKVLHRGHCQINADSKYEKNISILGVPWQNVILLEDSVYQAKNQHKNTLLIRPFRGDKSDTELTTAGKFLEEIATKEDVRTELARLPAFGLELDAEMTAIDQAVKTLAPTQFSKSEENYKEIDKADDYFDDENQYNVTEMSTEEDPSIALPILSPKKRLEMNLTCQIAPKTRSKSKFCRENSTRSYTEMDSFESISQYHPSNEFAAILPSMFPKSQFCKLKENRITIG